MGRLILMLVLCIAITGAGCQEQTNGSDIVKTTPDMTSIPLHIGTWERIGTYSNGALVSEYPATMELKNNSFHSVNDLCENSGTLEVANDTITMGIVDSSCPIIPGFETIVYKQSFNIDGSEMTIETKVDSTTVTEKYKRASE